MTGNSKSTASKENSLEVVLTQFNYYLSGVWFDD